MKAPVTLSRYLAGMLSLFVALLLTASFISLWTLNTFVQRSFVEMNALSAELVSKRLEEFFSRAQASLARLENLVRQPEIYPAVHRQAYLADVLTEFPFLDRIEIMDADARVLATAPADPDRIGVFRAGERVYEAVRGGPDVYWSESYISLKNNQPAITFGRQIGPYTALLDLNLEWLGEFAAEMHTGPDRNLEIRLTDGNGTLLFHPDGTYVRQRERQVDFTRIKEQIGPYPSLRVREGGESWLVSARKLRAPDWYVLVLYPRRVFFISLHSVLFGLTVLSLLMVLAGIVFWRTRLYRIKVAFAAISRGAQRIAEGDYGELEVFGAGFTEFQRVGASLNRMVAAVRVRELTLKDRERGFQAILDTVELVAVILDAQGIIRYVNPFMIARTGYTEAELTGRAFQTYLCAGDSQCPFASVLSGAAPSVYVRAALRNGRGDEIIIDWSIVRNLDAEGRLAGATGIGHDTTEIVRVQDRIGRSLREKEILLREVHHRVKNNLQIIISLLSLQQATTADSRVLDALQDAGDRIYSISLVHELLYGSEDFGDLDFRAYAESLTEHLLSRQSGPHIAYHFHFDHFPLRLTEAVPCGLIINEAVTNSIKHAFPPEDTGERRLDFLGGIDPDGLVRIVVRDNGSGFDGQDQPPAGKHLGLTIMQVLAEQLGGSLRVYAEGGTVVELVFKPRIQQVS